MLWAGLDLDDDGRTELTRLATGARAAANRAGIAVDGQRFRPHVTARPPRPPGGGLDWVRLLDAYARPDLDRSTGSTLVASYLGEGPRGRPRYEIVEESTRHHAENMRAPVRCAVICPRLQRVKIAVAKETRDGESRVAMVPELVGKLTGLGLRRRGRAGRGRCTR